MLSEMELVARIEQLRTELVLLALKHGLGSPEVLKKSQHLDEALNQYYHFTFHKASS